MSRRIFQLNRFGNFALFVVNANKYRCICSSIAQTEQSGVTGLRRHGVATFVIVGRLIFFIVISSLARPLVGRFGQTQWTIFYATVLLIQILVDGEKRLIARLIIGQFNVFGEPAVSQPFAISPQFDRIDSF